MELRAYQEKAVGMVRDELRKGNKRILLVMPTGSGKTHTMGDIASKTISKNGNQVLAMMHRRQLVMQMVDRFKDCEVDTGIIMSGIEPDADCKCQITTVQTYLRRLKLVKNMDENKFFVDATVCFIDECHHATAMTYQKILKHYDDKIVIGVTATPALASGAGLGRYFDAIVQPVSIKELIDQKFLVPSVCYGPSEPDLSKLDIVAGDYKKKDLGKIMTGTKLIGDVVKNWLRLAGDLKTLCFSVNVAHSKALKDEFNAHGVTAEHLDAYSDDNERDAVIEKFRSGQIQVLLNVGLYLEGTDIPEIEAILIARPTASLSLHLQLLGRGARPFPGKDYFLVIDNAGNIARHGYYEEDRIWQLTDKQQAAKAEPIKPEKKLRTCAECSFIFTGGVCPQCGLAIKAYKKLIETEEAELVQIGDAEKPEPTMEDKRKFYGQLQYVQRMKEYKIGWISHQYKRKFGCWPKGMKDVGTVPPDVSFDNWITYQNIKYHKSRKKETTER